MKLQGAAPVAELLTVMPLPGHLHLFDAATGQRLPAAGAGKIPSPPALAGGEGGARCAATGG